MAVMMDGAHGVATACELEALDGSHKLPGWWIITGPTQRILIAQRGEREGDAGVWIELNHPAGSPHRYRTFVTDAGDELDAQTFGQHAARYFVEHGLPPLENLEAVDAIIEAAKYAIDQVSAIQG